MNKKFYKILAIIFALFSLGALSETNRIMTSAESNIASQRTSLLIFAVSLTALIIGTTIYFWKKSK